MKSIFSFPLLIAAIFLSHPAPGQTAETKEQFDQRTQWWREAKFGMFIHWGLYAVPADSTNLKGEKGNGEWYFYNKQAQVKDYEKFAPHFNPVKFDAKQWVRTAKDAGMKYIVITSKHHDGFCLFDSKLTDYCITKGTPFQRDVLKELADECQKQGIRLCFYHSIMDWHHPDYVPRRPWEKDTRPAGSADLNKYIDYMKGQLKELLTNYGPVGIIWFDGGWEHNAKELRSEEVVAMIRSLQPGIIINDRIQLPQDYGTPEQYIPGSADATGRPWETCMTMNDTWGFAKNDTNWKSAETLIRNLCDIAQKGGNFLLNVGPTAEGEFPPEINERLAKMGAWLKINGDGIYATTQSPFRRLSFDGRCTRKGDKLYLFVFQWPEGGLKIEGLQTKVNGARALDGGETLKVTTAGDADNPVVSISKPAKLDPIATGIELQLAGAPVVLPFLIKPDEKGVLALNAVDADVHGKTARYEKGDGKDNIGFWMDKNDYVTWTCLVKNKGKYRVEVVYACPPENQGSSYTIGVDGQTATVKGMAKTTGSWTTFQPEPLGELEISAGKQTIAVRISEMPKGAAMNLKQVRLQPAGQ